MEESRGCHCDVGEGDSREISSLSPVTHSDSTHSVRATRERAGSGTGACSGVAKRPLPSECEEAAAAAPSWKPSFPSFKLGEKRCFQNMEGCETYACNGENPGAGAFTQPNGDGGMHVEEDVDMATKLRSIEKSYLHHGVKDGLGSVDEMAEASRHDSRTSQGTSTDTLCPRRRDDMRPTKRHKAATIDKKDTYTQSTPSKELTPIKKSQYTSSGDHDDELDDGELLVAVFDERDGDKHDKKVSPRQVQRVVQRAPRGKNISAVARAMARSSPVPEDHPLKMPPRGKDLSALSPSVTRTHPARKLAPPRDIEIDTTSSTRPLPPRIVSTESYTPQICCSKRRNSSMWSDDEDEEDDYKPLSIHIEPFMPLPTLFPYQEYSGFSDYGGHSRSRSASTFNTMTSAAGNGNSNMTLFDHLAEDLQRAAEAAAAAAEATNTTNNGSSRKSSCDMSMAAHSKNETSTINSVEMASSQQSRERSLTSMAVEQPPPPPQVVPKSST